MRLVNNLRTPFINFRVDVYDQTTTITCDNGFQWDLAYQDNDFKRFLKAYHDMLIESDKLDHITESKLRSLRLLSEFNQGVISFAENIASELENLLRESNLSRVKFSGSDLSDYVDDSIRELIPDPIERANIGLSPDGDLIEAIIEYQDFDKFTSRYISTSTFTDEAVTNGLIHKSNNPSNSISNDLLKNLMSLDFYSYDPVEIPDEGKADTLIFEMIRACQYICHRNLNDGDRGDYIGDPSFASYCNLMDVIREVLSNDDKTALYNTICEIQAELGILNKDHHNKLSEWYGDDITSYFTTVNLTDKDCPTLTAWLIGEALLRLRLKNIAYLNIISGYDFRFKFNFLTIN